MSRCPAKSGKAIATKLLQGKLLKEKWLSIVQSAREKGENGTGGSSTVTGMLYGNLPVLYAWFSIISFYNEHSSPKEALSAYLISLSHHSSLTFYDVPWSVHITGTL